MHDHASQLAQRANPLARPAGKRTLTLIYAARGGHADVVRQLMLGMTTEELRDIPHQRDKHGKNALDYAVEQGDARTLRALSEHEEVHDVPDAQGRFAAERFDPSAWPPRIAADMNDSLSRVAERRMAHLASKDLGHSEEARRLPAGKPHGFARMGA